ncbi:MAG: cytochrome c [Burkholderiaceae bacterium]
MSSFQTQACLALLLSGVWLGAAQAGDPVAGKALAAMCVTCHGAVGLSQFPTAPHLAGQPAIYTVEQLKNYRGGKRQNEMMSVIAKSLSDQEIKDLAAWYESIRISVLSP